MSPTFPCECAADDGRYIVVARASQTSEAALVAHKSVPLKMARPSPLAVLPGQDYNFFMDFVELMNRIQAAIFIVFIVSPIIAAIAHRPQKPADEERDTFHGGEP